MRKLPDWTNRRVAIFGAVIAVLCVMGSSAVAYALNRPNFFPTAVVLTDTDQKPVERSTLSGESLECDSAVRSMMLAFVQEIESASESLSSLERARATVESPFAIIPEECRSRIDNGFIVSADGIVAELKSPTRVGEKISISFILTNNKRNTRRFAISDMRDVKVRTAFSETTTTSVNGIDECGGICTMIDYSDSTPVTSKHSILVHVEAAIDGDRADDVTNVTLIMPIRRWLDRYDTEEVFLSFSNIYLTGATETTAAP